MSVHACTLMWGTAWERYGHLFAQTFDHWDESIDLTLVTDNNIPFFARPKFVYLKNLPGYTHFKEQWEENPVKVFVPEQHQWKYDAMKWVPQAVTPHHVISMSKWKDGDIFVWLDADTTFHGLIDEEWIEKVLDGHDVACLQRKPVHTEIGFYALRLNEKTRAAMKRFHDHYVNRTVFDLKEWHSAFVWDAAIDADPSITINNLNKTNDKTHVFPLSILAEKIVHNKGHRKPGGG